MRKNMWHLSDSLVQSLEPRRLLSLLATGSPFEAAPTVVAQSMAAARDPSLNSVIVWSDRDAATGLGNDVFLQRVTGRRANSGSPVQVNTTTTDPQMNVAIGLNGVGRGVIVWQSRGQDGDSWSIVARRWDNVSGRLLGGEIPVNAVTLGGQVTPAVAVGADGRFAVAWVSQDPDDGFSSVKARLFDEQGIAVTSDLDVSRAGGQEIAPTIAVDAAGRFIVAWTSVNTGTLDNTVFYRGYTAGGSPDYVATALPDDPEGDEYQPAAAVAGNSFVVAWVQATTPGASEVALRRVDVTGVKLGSEVVASDSALLDRSRPRLAGNAGGEFAIGWTQVSGGKAGVGLRLYTAATVPTGDVVTGIDAATSRSLKSLAFADRGQFWEYSARDASPDDAIGRPVVTPFANAPRVVGTSSADTITLSNNSQNISVSVNGAPSTLDVNTTAWVRIGMGDGNDILDAAAATIPLEPSGENGADRITTGSGRDTIFGGDGNDTVVAAEGNDYAIGNNGNDSLEGGGGNDTLVGAAGFSTLLGGPGDDRLTGSGSRDLIRGNEDNDALYGGGSSDTLDGGQGIDRVFGGDGDDVLVGGLNNDKLYGEAGNDTLTGNRGRDILDGGPGTDIQGETDPQDVLINIP